MYKYSTIAELIDALDAYWERNDTYELRYEYDTEYDLLDVKLYKDGELLHHAVCDELFDLKDRFKDYCVDNPELYAFIKQVDDFKYKPLPGAYEQHTIEGDIVLPEHVIVTDPCYDPGIWCNGELHNVRPGKYHTKVITKLSSWLGMGTRISDLVVWHESIEEPDFRAYEETDINVGVDSGTAGIFDYNHYVKKYKDEEWRDYMSFGTLDYDEFVKDEPDKLQQRCYVEWQQALVHLEGIEPLGERCEFVDTTRNYLWDKYGFDPCQFTNDGFMRRRHNRAYTDGHGVACSSGDGDGVYGCFIAKQDDEIVAIRLDFYITED